MSAAESYANWVLSPTNIHLTGNLVKLAAKRFLSDLKRDDIYFDEKEASKCINFIENHCLQWEGAWRGQPFRLQPWQKFALQNIYGWIKKNGKRRFTKAYIQISKKNGKSSLMAGVSLFHLLADERINTPKVFTAANNEAQAKICVNIAGKISEISPDIQDNADPKYMHYGENIITVMNEDPVRGSGFIKALSKEGTDRTSKTAGGKHGINASLGVVDEFGMSPDHGNSKTIDSSMVSRPERLMLYITTAGYNMGGPCYLELRDSGIKVLNRVINMDSYFPLIFEVDKSIVDGKEVEITIEWLLENEHLWCQSNPNIDVSVERDALRDILQEAKQYGGIQEREAKTLNFNIWVDSPDVFIQPEIWNANTHGIKEDDLLGQPCYGGIEKVGGGYLNCFMLLFPDVKGKTCLKPFFWIAENSLNKNNDKLKEWADEGYIKTFLGDVPDNPLVFDWLYNEISKYQMHSFAYLNNLATTEPTQGFIQAGIEGFAISDGRKQITSPTKMWEEMITAGKIEHFNNPVLTWMNSNCTASRKENDIRLDKSGNKVVGIYAGIYAIAQWKDVAKEGSGEIGILYL